MTDATLTRLEAMRSWLLGLQKTGRAKHTKTQMQNPLPKGWGGSDVQNYLKPLVDKQGTLVASKIPLMLAALNITTEAAPVPAPVPVKPVETPIAPPAKGQPQAGGRAMFNEQTFTDTSGNKLNIQNSNRPSTTVYLGYGHWLFDLKDSTDQRFSEKRPKGTKRRSEVSGLKVVSPKAGEVQVFAGQFHYAPQPFADNQQWVLAQRHGSANTGHPGVALRFEKGGFVVLSTCGSVTADSVDIKTKRTLPAGVWHDVQIKDFGGQKAELWINGELWATSNNPVGWAEEGLPYWKWGVYNSQGSNEHTTVEWRDITLNGKPVGVL